MSATGFLQVHAYASFAKIPLKDTAITVTDSGQGAIAMSLTNRSGKLDSPIEIPVPDLSASQSPDTGVLPYTTINLIARHSGYEQIIIENLQLFAGTVTVQNLEMIPLSEFPQQWNRSELFQTQPQKL